MDLSKQTMVKNRNRSISKRNRSVKSSEDCMEMQKACRYRNDAEMAMLHFKSHPEEQKNTRTDRKYKDAYRRLEDQKDQQ